MRFAYSVPEVNELAAQTRHPTVNTPLESQHRPTQLTQHATHESKTKQNKLGFFANGEYKLD